MEKQIFSQNYNQNPQEKNQEFWKGKWRVAR
jgi:hypothetical protein